MGGIVVVVAAILGLLVFFVTKAKGATVESYGTGGNSLDSIITKNAARYGIDSALIKAFIKTESNFNADAVNPISSDNAFTSYGLMQITPILAEEFGLVRDYHNITESEIAMIMGAETNVQIGSWYIGQLTHKYELDAAIQMYNVGESGYNSGRRNTDYLTKVKRYYDEYKPH